MKHFIVLYLQHDKKTKEIRLTIKLLFTQQQSSKIYALNNKIEILITIYIIL